MTAWRPRLASAAPGLAASTASPPGSAPRPMAPEDAWRRASEPAFPPDEEEGALMSPAPAPPGDARPGSPGPLSGRAAALLTTSPLPPLSPDWSREDPTQRTLLSSASTSSCRDSTSAWISAVRYLWGGQGGSGVDARALATARHVKSRPGPGHRGMQDWPHHHGTPPTHRRRCRARRSGRGSPPLPRSAGTGLGDKERGKGV